VLKAREVKLDGAGEAYSEEYNRIEGWYSWYRVACTGWHPAQTLTRFWVMPGPPLAALGPVVEVVEVAMGPPFAALGPWPDVADMGTGEPVWGIAAAAAALCNSASLCSRSA
jgi:hypothetical protein